MRFPRVERIRGRSLKFYFAIVAFGVATGYYINRPLVETFEEIRSKKQVERAVETINTVAQIEAKENQRE